MDPRLLDFYSSELYHLRESAAEFAKDHPKIAGRLTLDGINCADPYVERLLEGFAYLTARIQLKFDSHFPTFIQHLTEVVYPDYLSPVPAMTLVKFEPDYKDNSLEKGIKIPKDTALFSSMSNDMQTACEFRTAHEIFLWPIKISNITFETQSLSLPNVKSTEENSGCIRISIESVNNVLIENLTINHLSFYISADNNIASQIYEHLIAYSQNVYVTEKGKSNKVFQLGKNAIRAGGLGDSFNLLPISKKSFRAYRLLREYAAYPSRFMFFEIDDLQKALPNIKSTGFDLVIPLSKSSQDLERLVNKESMELFVTPAINLFPKIVDRVFVNHKSSEFHVVADRARPLDYEIHSIQKVKGFAADSQDEIPIYSLFSSIETSSNESDIFYSLRREKRVLSVNQKLRGFRTAYIGTEIFLGLVDTAAPPFPESLKQISIEALCTNRDLAIMIPTKQAGGDFTMNISAPIKMIKCIKAPSRPIEPAIDGDLSWGFINQLSLNYLSLEDTSPEEGAQALRQILSLYCFDNESPLKNQIKGIRSVKINPIIRRIPDSPTITFARGHEIELTVEQKYFEGFSPMIFASVLEQFFARHANLNSFTEMVLRVQGKGEVKRWSARLGRKPLL